MVVIIISKDVDCFKVGLVIRQNRNQTVYGGGGVLRPYTIRVLKKKRKKEKSMHILIVVCMQSLMC